MSDWVNESGDWSELSAAESNARINGASNEPRSLSPGSQILKPVKGSGNKGPRKKVQESWNRIRESYMMGASLSELAQRFGKSEVYIQRRAYAERWPRVEVKGEGEVVKRNLPAEAESTWNERAEAYRAKIFDKVSKAIEQAVPPEIETWRDMEIADRIARKAAGLESGELTVQASIIPIVGATGMMRDVTPENGGFHPESIPN